MPASALQTAVDEFLACRRIAVAGVSRKPEQPANLIYRKLRSLEYEVFPINPKAQEVEGDRAYLALAEIEPAPDAVVIATHPDATPEVAQQCIDAGIDRVWMHRFVGKGSVHPEAVERLREHGVTVIDGACPMMYLPPVDVPHRCFRFLLRCTGGLPRPA